MKKARLIMTLKCVRNCKGCCNTKEMINSAYTIKDIKSLEGYNEINITGGEPIMYPLKLISLLKKAKKLKSKPKLYLYMSITNPIYENDILNLVDGIHYTLHSDCSSGDVTMFENFQNYLNSYKKTVYKSFRLHIFPDISTKINLLPYVWDRIDFKTWVKDSPLPENEVLFILRK
jgi:organic radical activating enzyme